MPNIAICTKVFLDSAGGSVLSVSDSLSDSGSGSDSYKFQEQ